MTVVLLSALLLSFTTTVQSFTCQPPTQTCPAKDSVLAGCPYGVVKDDCGYCWVCAKGLVQQCGGSLNRGGTCAAGLYCTNPPENSFGGDDNQNPGICCRNVPPPNTTDSLPCPTTSVVRNPCTLDIQCAREEGHLCGGPGGIEGLCESPLVCQQFICTNPEGPTTTTEPCSTEANQLSKKQKWKLYLQIIYLITTIFTNRTSSS